MEKPKFGKFETLTKENFEDVSARLGKLNWEGKYDEALPLADQVFEYRSEHGDRDAALVNYASNYYSAASRLWKEKRIKAADIYSIKMFKLAEKYPWPDENISADEVSKNLGKYGQAARVARYLRDTAHKKGDDPEFQEFAKKAEAYAAYVPDQKAKL